MFTTLKARDFEVHAPAHACTAQCARRAVLRVPPNSRTQVLGTRRSHKSVFVNSCPLLDVVIRLLLYLDGRMRMFANAFALSPSRAVVEWFT